MLKVKSREGFIDCLGNAQCYVLENGQRVLTLNGAIRVLTGARERGDFGQYIGRIPSEFRPKSVRTKFIEFALPTGGTALGIDSTRCPHPQCGNNKHQWLQDEIQRLTERDIDIMTILAQESRTKEEFWQRMNYRYRGEPMQYDMRWN